MLGVFFRQSTTLLFLQILLILIYACRNSPNKVEETELDFQIDGDYGSAPESIFVNQQTHRGIAGRGRC